MTAALEPETFDLTVIAVGGLRAGILSRDAGSFRFHASHHRFDALDGCRFASIGEAKSAAVQFAAMEPLSHRALKPWR